MLMTQIFDILGVMKVVKASGDKEEYSKDKLCGSLEASGASPELVEKVCIDIEKGLVPGSTTTEIWRRALRVLAKENLSVAARYNIRRGIAGLGPAGFLFEQFVEVLLRAIGYDTKRNQMIDGKCVPHEVDVVAERDNKCFLLEVKYHNRFGIKVAIDVVMYADARREDISRGGKTCEMWVFTNTKFSGNAIRYAKCRKMKLVGWRYPKDEGLETLIVKHALFPITVLPSVNKFSREVFARHGMMLAQDLAPYKPESLENQFGIKLGRAKKIVKEAHELMYGK